ncbi:PREDICTED: basic salivary proline-rich protein 3-like [Sturnus vulgaris]|uniref:basic salivary proline-rich protein 3-like n=1 Tax=Sturnus vulgaris TaxID=9172 RepID=UPI00071A7F2D|nr:PREDICTED: basic salivary proline-rich protein 3-like [Sturnus vulgaris]
MVPDGSSGRFPPARYFPALTVENPPGPGSLSSPSPRGAAEPREQGARCGTHHPPPGSGSESGAPPARDAMDSPRTTEAGSGDTRPRPLAGRAKGGGKGTAQAPPPQAPPLQAPPPRPRREGTRAMAAGPFSRQRQPIVLACIPAPSSSVIMPTAPEIIAYNR